MSQRDDDLHTLATVLLNNLRCDDTRLYGYESSLEPGIAKILGVQVEGTDVERDMAFFDYLHSLYRDLPQYLRDHWSPEP